MIDPWGFQLDPLEASASTARPTLPESPAPSSPRRVRQAAPSPLDGSRHRRSEYLVLHLSPTERDYISEKARAAGVVTGVYARQFLLADPSLTAAVLPLTARALRAIRELAARARDARDTLTQRRLEAAYGELARIAQRLVCEAALRTDQQQR